MLFEFSLLGSSSGVLSSDTDSDPKFVQAFIWPQRKYFAMDFSQVTVSTVPLCTLSTITCFGCICAADLVFCRPRCDVTVHRSEKSTSLRQFDIPWRQRTSASTVFPASFPCHHTLCTTNVSIYANKNQRVRRKCKIRKKEECEKKYIKLLPDGSNNNDKRR